jgi:hypothetical protein
LHITQNTGDAQIPNPRKAPNPKNTVETVSKTHSLYTGATLTNTYSTQKVQYTVYLYDNTYVDM